jgi:hypothetical protein
VLTRELIWPDGVRIAEGDGMEAAVGDFDVKSAAAPGVEATRDATLAIEGGDAALGPSGAT